ncbi:MAG: hypothetical protein ACI87E_002919 [Mariniblastus sp.]
MVSPSVAPDVKVEYFEGRHCRLRETTFQLLTIIGTLPTGFAELGVTIHNQISFAIEKTVFMVDQLAGHLFHPLLMRTGRAASQMNTTSFLCSERRLSFLTRRDSETIRRLRLPNC